MEKRFLISIENKKSNNLSKGWINTDFGCLEILCAQEKIAHLSFSVEKHDTTDYLCEKVQEWVKSGKIDIAFRMTDFQKRVYEELIKVNSGEKISYEDLATKVGSKAVRAVGSAMAKNQVALLIPCHRVIRKSGDIGNYAGGKSVKRALLSFEEQGGNLYELFRNCCA
jgi:O-6-methylguanine DNA methyltransferase